MYIGRPNQVTTAGLWRSYNLGLHNVHTGALCMYLGLLYISGSSEGSHAIGTGE